MILIKKLKSTFALISILSLTLNQAFGQVKDFTTADYNKQKISMKGKGSFEKLSRMKIGKVIAYDGKVRFDARAVHGVGQDLYIGSIIETTQGNVTLMIGENQIIEISKNTRFRIVPLAKSKFTNGLYGVGAILDEGRIKAVKILNLR